MGSSNGGEKWIGEEKDGGRRKNIYLKYSIE